MPDDIVVRAERLGKKYLIGHDAERERHQVLRDVIARNTRSAWRKTVDMLSGRPIIGGDTVEEIWALKDVNFEVRAGEVLGIIGHNGAGKSTLLKILSRITDPSQGSVIIHGRIASLLEIGTGFHHELTGRENIYLSGAIMGMSRAEIRQQFDEIVAFAEIDKFLDTPVKRYSSGMYLRLAFSVAAHLNPEILLIDEVLGVGDKRFQDKCLGKMQLAAERGRTVLVVSHNMPMIKNVCSRVIVLSEGSVLFSGLPASAIDVYIRGGETAVQFGSLRNRADRSGDGRLRFTDAYVVGPDRNKDILPMGAAARIVVSYHASEMIERFDISIHIDNSYNDTVLRLATIECGATFNTPKGDGHIVCVIPSLPLLPGRYNILLAASVPPAYEYLDYVSRAAYFEVLEDDIFGTGKIPTHGAFFTRCEWRHQLTLSPVSA